MTTALTPTDGATLAEQAVIAGDLAKLSPDQRMAYYGEVCRSLGLNPLTQPFAYISLNDKLTLYARRDATDQLRNIHGVSVQIVSREIVEGVYVVTARATTADGRSDESVGAVPLLKEDGEWKTSQNGKRYFAGNGQFKPLGPEDRANAMMKAETKAKRRVTLSVIGLGWLDETEVETIRDARRTNVDMSTGEIVDASPFPPPATPSATRPAYPRTPVAATARKRPPSRDKLIERIAELTETAAAQHLDIALIKPLDEMTDDELIAHGKALANAIEQAADAEPVAA